MDVGSPTARPEHCPLIVSVCWGLRLLAPLLRRERGIVSFKIVAVSYLERKVGYGYQ